MNGLISFFLGGFTGKLSDNPTVAAGGRRYKALKSVLYVTLEAADRTTVELVSPPSARLYYTNFGPWGDVSDARILRVADTTVIVPSCQDETVGYPGELLVTGPACVTVRISGGGNFDKVVRTVPVGRESCPTSPW